MFRFETDQYLQLLWVIPVVIALYILFYAYKKSVLRRLGSDPLVNRLMPGFRKAHGHVRIALLLLVISFVVLAAANPQWGTKKEKVQAKSSDVFIALDLSQSMLAEDISPNRLERAKRVAVEVINGLKGNRIGLIYFAGNAYLQMPLTSDYSAAQLFVNSANTKQATTQGTAIGEAINLALSTFEEDKPNQRALIVFTDGENHDDEALKIATDASSRGLSIFTVGVGTPEGAFIPIRTQGREQYKRDETGQPVKTALNMDLVRNLASNGNGRSFHISEGNKIIEELRAEIARLEKEEVEQRAFSDYASYFQYFILIGIFLLVIEFIIPERKSESYEI